MIAQPMVKDRLPMHRRRSGPKRGADRAGRGLLRRAVWVLARLKTGAPIRATLLAREFEISVRTAYRDLDFLRDEWRVPLEFDRARRTFYLTEPTAFVTPITLSRGEVVSLFFAEKVLRQYRGTPFESDLASALRKLQQLMPDEVSVSPETLDTLLSLDIGPTYTSDAAIFVDILAALRQRRTALVRYRSLNSGRTTDRRVQPYHLFNHRGDWYVAAWDSSRATVRDFALHRIRRVAITTERSGRPVFGSKWRRSLPPLGCRTGPVRAGGDLNGCQDPPTMGRRAGSPSQPAPRLLRETANRWQDRRWRPCSVGRSRRQAQPCPPVFGRR